MQTQKAENMIEHEAEIYARPPRTWFQTEKQKKESAKRGRPGAEEEADDQGEGNKKQKREAGKGKKEKGKKEDRAKQKRGDELLEVTFLHQQCALELELLISELLTSLCSTWLHALHLLFRLAVIELSCTVRCCAVLYMCYATVLCCQCGLICCAVLRLAEFVCCSFCRTSLLLLAFVADSSRIQT